MLTIENDVLVKCDENATEVVIPADVKQIKKNAFEGCKALKTLRFPKDFDFVPLYGDFYPGNRREDYFGVFFFESLTDVYYEGTITEWIEAQGYHFFKENIKIHCKDGDTLPLTFDMDKIVIPSGVTKIPDNAFLGYNCKEIEIPDSVTEIGCHAFEYTSNLESITLPAGLTDIGHSAFEDSGFRTINFKGTKEQWKKVYKDSPWGWVDSSALVAMVEVDIVHCSDGDVVFAEVLSIDNGVLYGPADDFICPFCSIPVDVTKIVKNAFDLDWHFFEKYDFDFDLTYEGTKEQWFKIDKGENWDGNKVFVVHCSDGDIQIDNGCKELDEKLLDAINENNFEEVVKLITAGANVNAADESGYTALMYAAVFKEKEIAKLLVEQGADVNAVNKQGSSTYEIFIHFYGKNSGIVEFLVQHGAKTNVHNLFIEAIKNNNTDEVLKFINNGANLNHIFYIPSEYTPLSMAAKYDSKEVAELLIEHGAEVNPEPFEYYLPLSAAAEWNAKNVAEVLINHGARLDTDDSLDRDVYYIFDNLRPWDYAIINNSKDVIEVFLNHGYACDKVGIYDKVEDNFKNSIAYAEEHNFTELAELLKKHLKKSEN